MGCSFRPDWVAGFLRIRWQLCTGLGGRNHRNTQMRAKLPENPATIALSEHNGGCIHGAALSKNPYDKMRPARPALCSDLLAGA